MDADQFRKAAHAAIEEIISYNQNITSYPVVPKIKPGYLAPQLPASAPDEPQPWSSIQPDIASKIIPGLTHWQSPKFLAFFPAGVTYPSILGEMYSAAFTAPAFNWLCSPACTELETVVLDWLAQAFSLPKPFHSTSSAGGGGVIQGSASEAVVTCMVAARERYLHTKCDAEGLPLNSPEREDRIAFLRSRLVALAPDQAHSSTQKGALIAGTRFRSIPTSLSDNLALSPSDLDSTISACRAEGLEPYYITLTFGTTSTCSIDPLPLLSPVLKKHPDIWVHVDAAYAGAALLLPSISETYAPHLTIADSFDMNMHKWLLVNFDASCLWVQDRNHLTRALSISAAYYTNKHSDSGLVTDYRDWQIPLGRRFRALKIWFVMRSYGISGMTEHVARTIKIGETFADLVRSRDDLYEIIGQPQFALTCFRVKPSALNSQHQQNTNAKSSSGSETSTPLSQHQATIAEFGKHPSSTDQVLEQEANAITKEITDLINERGEIFITGSNAAGKTFIRVVSGNPAAEEKYIREAWETIVQTTEEVLEQRRKRGKENGHAA